MRENILEALRQPGRTIISDGAFGTFLLASGLPAGTLPEVWNAERPDVVRSIHQAYLDAGAELLTTNTFRGSALRDAGLGDRLSELVRRGAELAREVAGDRAWVAGSIGPVGQILEPYGDLTIEAAGSIFAAQAEALAAGGADVILLETQHDLAEALLALQMARAHTALPVFCTFAFNLKGRTMMGLRPDEAARRVQEEGGTVVGANCGDGPGAILAGLQGMQGATTLPLMAQSNAGLPQLAEGSRTVWDVTPEQMVTQVKTFRELGARIIGGCCGTSPEFIRAIAAAVRS